MKSVLEYLNYYHFRINIKRMTTKERVEFMSMKDQEEFPLSCIYSSREIMIIDPARGRYCQHYAFADLRLFYLSYDKEKNVFRCPIEGCG